MAELQQEVAWRMGSWQPLEDQGPSSGPATQDIGINSAIRAGLQVCVAATWAQPGCNKSALLAAEPMRTPPAAEQAVKWLLKAHNVEVHACGATGPGSNAVDTMLNICSCPSQALVSGDREQCSGVLAAARQSVVRALVSVSTESSANVNPAVLQLQQLSAIEAAWGVKWPQMQLQPQVPTVQVRRNTFDPLPVTALHQEVDGRVKHWASNGVPTGACKALKHRRYDVLLLQAAWQPAKNSQQPKLSLARLNDKWRQQEAEAGGCEQSDHAAAAS